MKINYAKSRSIRLLMWVALPLLLVAAIAVGSVSIFGAHAAAPKGSHYNFRGIATIGPATGLYLTGSMVLFVSEGDKVGKVTGNICSLKIGTQSCTLLSGTQSGNAITITIGHLNGYSSLVLTGTLMSVSNTTAGFDGTFTLGASQGKWTARITAFPPLTGTWNLYGSVHQGQDANKQFHGVLSLIQQANGQVSGTYCPVGSSCVNVTGGKNRGNFFFYIHISVLNQVIRFQGSAIATKSSRLTGQFQSLNPNLSTADKGYWVGH